MHERSLFWRYQEIDVPALPSNFLQGAVGSGDWKYVKMGSEEFLFHLATDRREEIDHSTDNINIFEQLAGKYQKWSAQLEVYSV